LPAVDSVLQTMGRGIRQPTDWCYCLLIDDRFEQYKKYFPKDIQVRMKNMAWDKIAQSVKDFSFEMSGI
jgi:Rad3-related DNA helicase